MAEVYGPSQQVQIAIARQIRDIFKGTHGVVDVDWYVEDDQCEYRLVVDQEKAALNSVAEETIARTMQAAELGYAPGHFHVDASKERHSHSRSPESCRALVY